MSTSSAQTVTFSFDDGVRQLRLGETTAETAAERLIAQLTDKELLWLLDGDTPIRALPSMVKKISIMALSGGALPRLGIPGIRFSDGPRGVVIGHSTAFPVTIARAATWEPDLEERVGQAMGVEARAAGANYSGAVCVNLLRHPAWGRAQECYGEDPVLTGRMGAGLTRGLRRNVMACVKHFALNSMENARFTVDVTVDDQALHEVYLPHFKTVIEAGADSVMSSYNSVNGDFLDVNKILLTDVLRDEWGFDGFVSSDWVFGIHDAVRSLEAGMDVEMPLRLLRARALPEAFARGQLARETVLTSARRILTTTLRHYAIRDEGEPPASVIAKAEHRVLARHVAARGSVLLKNEPVGGAAVLPLAATIRRLAVIGALATEANLGDHGSSRVRPPAVSSPLDGLREALPHTQIMHLDGSDPAAAARAATDADVAIVVAGMTWDDEGEFIANTDMDSLNVLGFPFNSRVLQFIGGKLATFGKQFAKGGDREVLTLHGSDEALISTVVAANPRTAVVVIGGSAIIMEAWRHQVAAILMAWYPGMEGGRAVADVLIGAQEPGGRLPVAIPTDARHLPFFDAHAKSIVYDSWWGQRKLDRDGNAAAYPFGFGLGYTTFDMELIDHAVSDQEAVATVRVMNTGRRAGSTVAQVYALSDAADAVPQLVGFRRVELPAGGEETVEISLDLTPTKQRDPETGTWSRRPGEWGIVVSSCSPTTPTNVRPLLVDSDA
ncbi:MULTISPECIES: beta-glucosidase family protein [unclassified Mycobacterium]|uniref:beta-glucosidase family protein n=1 Tax=unclassified Mycobacterium TaxID=2642494 RepID=UPI0029C82D60|nr:MULTISPECIES: glycoside hydrolase family 3 C-terminal domain-containing protein [unclassified Mycobacterium]